MTDKPQARHRAAYRSQGVTKMVSIRMPVALIEKINAKSAECGVSKNQFICNACASATSK